MAGLHGGSRKLLRLCTIEGCGRKYYGRGYCHRHWAALNLYGDPLYRKRKPIEFNGQSKSIAEWAKGVNMLPQSLGERLRNGWPIELALTVPAHKHGGPRVGPKWEQMKVVRAQSGSVL